MLSSSGILGFWKLPKLTSIVAGVRLGYAASNAFSRTDYLAMLPCWDPDNTLILLNRLLQKILN